MSENIKYPIYDLSPKEFEELSLELISTTNHYVNLSLSTNPNDYLFADIYGEFYSENNKIVKVAIEVKHWLKFNVNLFKHEVTRRIEQLNDDTFIQFITSAKIENHQRDQVNDIISPFRSHGMQIYDQTVIFHLLDKNPKIANKYFQPIINKNKKLRLKLIVSFLTVLISIAGTVFSLTDSIQYLNKEESYPLDLRIERVEKALTNIKDLEKYLGNIKSEMEETRKDVSKIKDEYEQVQKLKSLSNEELAVLNSALQKRDWYEIPLNYLLGFLIGVASSIIGSIVYDRYKRRKQLQ